MSSPALAENTNAAPAAAEPVVAAKKAKTSVEGKASPTKVVEAPAEEPKRKESGEGAVAEKPAEPAAEPAKEVPVPRRQRLLHAIELCAGPAVDRFTRTGRRGARQARGRRAGQGARQGARRRAGQGGRGAQGGRRAREDRGAREAGRGAQGGRRARQGGGTGQGRGAQGVSTRPAPKTAPRAAASRGGGPSPRNT